ncbi:MAG: trigger factor [Erysipelotrichaceae bacterium]|nr:trigger factor [Erysipelotrichaceae bacterium]
METVCNKLENCRVEIVATYEGDEWKNAQKKALNKLAKQVKIDGFREGHAPAKMVKARIGMARILEDAVEVILKDCFDDVFTKNNIMPVDQPQADIDEINEKVLKLKFTTTVAPEIKLGQYKGLDVVKEVAEVTDEEIDSELKNYQQQFAELVIKEEGTVENGDSVVIDYEGFKDDEPFDGGKAENYTLEIGSGSFIPGFEDQIIGMGIDEEKDLHLTFPEDYGAKDLAGQEVVFKVKVHEIKTKVLPEIDDELAKDVNKDGVETLDDLKQYISEQTKNRKQSEMDQKFYEDLRDALISSTPIDVPAVMVDKQLDSMMKDIEQSLSQQGITLDMYAQITGKTKDDMKEDYKEEAEKRVKYGLILDEVVKAENIEVSDEDVEKYFNDISAYYDSNVDEMKKIFANNMDAVKADIASSKAAELIENSVGVTAE